jgi:ADP-heptose:LPS heptosyltransferase
VTNLWRRPPPDELVERRFLRLLAADGLIAPDDVDLPLRVVLTDDERRKAAEALPAGLSRPVLVLPGAGMPIKRWPTERWADLVAGLAALGHTCLTVPDGADLPGVRVLPRMGLRELAATAAVLAERGGIAVGGDTGPVRLATAAGLPAIGLYGPTLAARYGLSDPAGANLQGLPGCEVRRPTAITEQDCWWSARCPLTSDGGAACMADLPVAVVVDAVRAVAGRASRRRAETDRPGRGRP